MKIEITQTFPDGQIKRQVLTKNESTPLKIQALPNAQIAFNIEQVALGEKSNKKVKHGDIKKVGNRLVLESASGEPLVEVGNFYITEGVSISEVSWAQPSESFASPAIQSDEQPGFTHAAPSFSSVSDSSMFGTKFAQAETLTYGQATVVTDASTTSAASATSSTAAEIAQAQFAGSVSASSLALGAFGVGAVAIAASTTGAAAVVATTRSYSIAVVFGPATDNGAGTKVTLYKVNGELLGEATYNAKTGKYDYTDATGYDGVVIAKMVDTDPSADYRDEATGKTKNADGVYLAVFKPSSTGDISLNINPLTTAAAQKMGVVAETNTAPSAPSNGLQVETITAVNKAIAKAFNVVDAAGQPLDISIADVKSAVDTTGVNSSTSNNYGKALAVVSQMEQVGTLSTVQVIEQVAAALDTTTGKLASSSTTTTAEIIQTVYAQAVAQTADKGQLLATDVSAFVNSATSAAVNNTTSPADLTSLQVAALTAAQIKAFTPAQIVQLGDKLAQLSDSALSSLDSTQLVNISNVQLSALGTKVLALSVQDNAAVSAAQTLALPVDGAGITALGAKLAKLPTSVLSNLSSEQLAGITGSQIDVLSPDQIGVLANKLSQLSDSALSSLDSTQLVVLSSGQISALGSKVFNLSISEVGSLTDTVKTTVTKVQTDELAKLSADGVAALGTKIANLSNAALATLTVTQAPGLSAVQIDVLSQTQVSQLSAAAVGKLSIAALASLDAAQLGALTATQLAGLTAEQMPALSVAQMQSFNGAAMASIPAAALAALSGAQVAALSAKQLSDLGASIQNLSVAALTSLSNAQLSAVQKDLGSLYTEVTKAIATAASTTSGANLTGDVIAGFSDAVISALSPTVISQLTTDALLKLKTQALSSTQAAKLSGTQIDSLIASQISALSPAALASLSADAVASLDATQIGAITATQAAQLTASQIDTFSATQIQALNPKVLASLNAAAFGSLDATQVAALSATQVANLTAVQVFALSASLISQLKPEAIANLSPAVLAQLSTTQIKALTATQLAAMGNLTVTASLLDDVDSVQGTVLSGGLTNDNTPTFSGTLKSLPPGAIVAVYDTFNGVTTKLGNAVVTNATNGNTWTFTPSMLSKQGEHNITVNIEVTGGNKTDAVSGITFTLDTVAPTVSTVTDATTTSVTNSAITFTVTFDEAVAGTVGTGNFTASNASITSVKAVDAKTYTVVATPNAGVASGNVALSLVAGSLKDAAGNALVNADLSGKDHKAIDTLAPTLSKTSYDVNESTTLPASDVVVATLVGTDASSMKYTLGSNGADNSLFSLVGGVLKLNAGKSFEDTSTHANVYNLTVDITDDAGNVLREKAITVNLKDVNEAPTAVALSFSSSILAELPGTTPTSTASKLADITITDDALGANTITLTGADKDKFEVVDNALYLKAGVTLDYEANAAHAYQVTVNVQDNTVTGSSAVSTNYTLNLTNVNEAPTLATPTAITLTDTQIKDSFDNQTGQLQGNDVDAGTTLSYGIANTTPLNQPTTIGAVDYNVSKAGTYGTLYVQSSTGKYVYVANAAAINALTSNQNETFTVTVADNAVSPLNATATLTVNVTGANDAPVLVSTFTTTGNTPVAGNSDYLQMIVGQTPATNFGAFYEDPDTGDVVTTFQIVSVDNNIGATIPGLTLDANGNLIGKPTDAGVTYPKDYSVVIRAKDASNPAVYTDHTYVVHMLKAPTIQSFSVTDTNSANGTNLGKSGETLDVAVQFSEVVNVTGSPTIKLSINDQPVTGTYNGTGSSTNTLHFSATVPAGSSADGKYIAITAVTANTDGASVIGQDSQQAWNATPFPQAVTTYEVDNTPPTVTTNYNSPENTIADTTKHTVQLLAADASSVTWSSSITGDDASKFSLSSTGLLSFVGNTNFEAQDDTGTNGVYDINVTATDAAGNVTTQAVAIHLTNVNEAPSYTGTSDVITLARAIASPSSSVTNDFTDPDGANGLGTPKISYTLANGSSLPTGVTLNEDGTFGVNTGTVASAGTYTFTVVATDHGVADSASPLSDSHPYTLKLVDTPALAATQALVGVNNLDVRSALVLTFNQAVKFSSGGTYHIHLYDDMGTSGLVTTNNSSSTGTKTTQDVTDNDVDITITNGVVTGLTVGALDYTQLGLNGTALNVGMSSARMAQSAKIVGDKLIIDVGGGDVSTNNYNFDLDFGSNYHIAVDAGLISSLDGSQSNAAIGSAAANTGVSFKTVTPAADTTGAASQIQNADGSLSSSYLWHSAHQGSGTTQTAAVAIDFSTGAHALVTEAKSVTGTAPNNTTFIAAQVSGNINLTGFGANDLLYTDNNGNMAMLTTQATKTATWSGAAATGSSPTATVKEADGGNTVNVWFADYGMAGGPSAGYSVGTGTTGLAGTGAVYFEGPNAYNKDLVIFG
jgi:trimeric autotransporter adhesin